MKAIVNGKLVFPDRITYGVVLVDKDRIIASGEEVCIPEGAEIIDADGLYVGPGLFDQHVHGYKQYGEAFDVTDNARATALCHLKHGTTQITPSAAYNLSKEDFISVIDQCNAAIKKGDTSIVGIHFEGPFTNPLNGANSQLTWEFSEELCSEIFERAGKNVLHCTYAPEMPHGKRMEEVLKKYKVIPDIGHTRADPESIYRGVENGAKIVTHLFDAMGNYKGADETVFSFTGDPQECVSDIVLSIPGLYYELICDSRSLHVRPVSIRQTYRAASEDYIICISDATGSEGKLNPEDYPPEDPKSAKDLNFNEKGELSGSRLVAAQSVANFMANTGADVRVGFKAGSTNSAKALNLYDDYGSIDAGKFANIIFVDERFSVKQVMFKGEMLDEVRPELRV
ncbi:MAG: amidohydrolase family protein [Eubacteriales bacterium]|nr:amidohydrolase family protein [Eubacteriales bacterium]